MSKSVCSLFVVLGLVGVGFVVAEDLSGSIQPSPPLPGESRFPADFKMGQSLVDFYIVPTSDHRCEIDPLVWKDDLEDRNQVAEQRLREIQKKMAQLATDYPETAPAKIALEWLNKTNAPVLDVSAPIRHRRRNRDSLRHLASVVCNSCDNDLRAPDAWIVMFTRAVDG